MDLLIPSLWPPEQRPTEPRLVLAGISMLCCAGWNVRADVSIAAAADLHAIEADRGAVLGVL